MCDATRIYWTVLVGIWVVLFGGASSFAAPLNLQWDVSQDPAVAGYKVYVFATATGSTNVVEVGNTNVVAVHDLEPASNYRFFVTALSRDGIESDPSNEVQYSAPALNTPPALAAIPAQTVLEGNTATFTASASDLDVPAQTLTFGFGTGAPGGATIDPRTGVFIWQPTAGQGGSTNVFSVFVRDDGNPSMTATQLVTIIVQKPVLPPKYYSLKIGSFGNGTISISPKATLGVAGATYLAGTKITVTATPRDKAAFKEWIVNGVATTANPLIFTIQQNTVVTPVFDPAGSPASSVESISLQMTLVGSGLGLLVGGEMGAWILDGSTDLVAWTEVATGLTSEQLALEPTGSYAFYRARPRPLAAFSEEIP